MGAHGSAQVTRTRPDTVTADGAPGTPPVVVLLSDPVRRLRLAGALQRAGHGVTVPREPMAWLAAHRSPVLVIDDTDAARRLRERIVATAPPMPCVALVREHTVARYRQVLASGATALPDTCADDDVVLAVGAAARGLACVPVEVARALAGHDRQRPVISTREASWLRALVDGATVAGLARTVGYSQREMYRVLGNLYERLGAANRTEALLRADRWGLLGPTGDRNS